MSGDIDVVSEEGKGSTFIFTVRLPLYRHRSLSGAIHPKDTESALVDIVKGARILVMEDNVVNQKVITKMLNSLGCSVTVRLLLTSIR